jgi:Domain of unknown function (DUF6378)
MMKAEMLDLAKEIVTRDRQNDYGTAEENFGTIAEFWSTYLRAKYRSWDIELTPADVAAMMVMMKVSRITTSPRKEDNWVDIAGYAACGAEVTHDSSGG